MLWFFFVLENEPQKQEERETEAMELEIFTDVSSSFYCKSLLFWGERALNGAECLVLSLFQLIKGC